MGATEGEPMRAENHSGLSIKSKHLEYNLLIIQALIIVLPVFILSYLFYTHHISFQASQFFLLAFTLVLILAGLVILRQLADRFLKVVNWAIKAEKGSGQLLPVEETTAELKQISLSFNTVLEKLEKTTAELKLRMTEIAALKELVEAASKIIDIDILLELLLEKAMTVTGAQIGSVFRVDSQAQNLRVVTARGHEPEIPHDACLEGY